MDNCQTYFHYYCGAWVIFLTTFQSTEVRWIYVGVFTDLITGDPSLFEQF